VFNYDRTIEHYFDTVLAAAFNLGQPAATELRKASLPILHVHGAIPESQAFGAYRPQISGERALALGDGILVIHDIGAAKDPAVFSRTNATFAGAQQGLGRATAICFLGFGYHELSIERLGVRDIQGRQFYGSRYKMGDARVEVANGLINQAVKWGDRESMSAEFLNESVPLR
jgi:hypothetical protein